MTTDSGQYFDYVRGLGQWHLGKLLNSNGETLCGAPMLSHNKANEIPEEFRVKCSKCFAAMEEELNGRLSDE